MQHKLFALFLAVVIIIAMIHFMPKPLYKQIDVDNATCQVFCQNTTLPCANVGFGKIVECSGGEYATILANCQGIDGVSFCFDGSKVDVERLLCKLLTRIHTTQTIGNLVVFCGYSPKITGGIVVDGHKTNVQIAFDGNTITIGSPLILGSY